MNEVEKSLNEELYTITINDDINLRNNIAELCYSAEETGMLPCRVDSDMAILIWKLVEIAIKYHRDNLPSNFKM